MKRRKFLVVLSGSVFAFSGCVSDTEIEDVSSEECEIKKLTIESQETFCSNADKEVTHNSEGPQTIEVIGKHPVPNPCYKLEIEGYDLSGGNKLSINLSKKSTGEICPQCVAVVKYNINIKISGRCNIEEIDINVNQ